MKSIFITGGAGFIGSNAANYFFKKKWKVYVFDNLSRIGSSLNINQLLKEKKIIFIKGNVKDFNKLSISVSKIRPNVILHCAGQVAVTSSIKNPRKDFEDNALGTFNILESIRLSNLNSTLIYTSTNKVYGSLKLKKLKITDKRYLFKYNKKGINENEPIDLYSPYGCSKGSADQYVRDYSRIYGLNTYVLRQSCIYGVSQIGVEDQGWLAWFVLASFFKKKLKIFGNGKQVRDLLYIDDLVRLFEIIANKKKHKQENIYNVGGGNNFTLSILELIGYLKRLSNHEINFSFNKWRLGDQKIFISDNSKLYKDFKWKPKIPPKEGIKKIFNWVSENENTIKKVLK